MGITKIVKEAYQSIKQLGKDLWSIHPYNTIKTYVKAYKERNNYEPKPTVQA
jgi:hypothetical protein